MKVKVTREEVLKKSLACNQCPKGHFPDEFILEVEPVEEKLLGFCTNSLHHKEGAVYRNECEVCREKFTDYHECTELCQERPQDCPIGHGMKEKPLELNERYKSLGCFGGRLIEKDDTREDLFLLIESLIEEIEHLEELVSLPEEMNESCEGEGNVEAIFNNRKAINKIIRYLGK